jgi:hypothetical protein
MSSSEQERFVPANLKQLADLYAQRNAVYKDDYKRFGRIMMEVLGPNPISLESADEVNRFCLFVHILGKVCRYAQNFKQGGHDDSLDDTAVYSMMLKEVDADIRQGTPAGADATGGGEARS